MNTKVTIEYKDGKIEQHTISWLDFLAMWKSGEYQGRRVAAVTAEGKRIVFE